MYPKWSVTIWESPLWSVLFARGLFVERTVELELGGIGMNKRAIELMVAHGDDVTIVEVAEGGHYSIITEAMREGMIDWALGQGERPDTWNYRYIPLDRNSTYPRGSS